MLLSVRITDTLQDIRASLSCQTQSGWHLKGYVGYRCSTTITMYLGGVFWFEIITIILGNHFVVISHQEISPKYQVEHLLAQFYLKILRYKCSFEKGLFWLIKITQTYQNLHIFM